MLFQEWFLQKNIGKQLAKKKNIIEEEVSV